ncbi:auxin-responsive protein SAUR78-like [Macadamia integrifolia]|uniref:auxin-responsive protein SAUR78-like n=1 Tax=Macadamia integrifolia TaxID=60698 RepID=UPI001C528D00|nr:auxin-responsive protein SAUR78-like [Macadamia integrifolia]
MAKRGKLTKLKSVLKRWQSMNKFGRSNGGSSIAAANPSDDDDEGSLGMAGAGGKLVLHQGGLHPVYVGKSRRRYLISSDVIEHPLFRELVEKSEGSDSITVGCEVVLFQHMLWMLENAEPHVQQESLDELVDFYAC